MNDAHTVQLIKATNLGVAPPPQPPGPKHSYWQRYDVYDWIAKNCFQPLVIDPRNDEFVYCTLMMLLTVFVSAALLLVSFSWWRAVLHIALMLSYVGSFTAILHNCSHRPMYAYPFSVLNLVVPYVLGPVFGQTWNTYYYHHVKHHHVEDNGPNDLSSTLRFQRDSFLHFALYFFRFFFLIVLELPLHFWRRGQSWNAVTTFSSEVLSIAAVLLALPYNPLGVLFVFVIPFVIVRFGMMSGNWAQHAFIDPKDPRDNFKSSTICIGHAYNLDAYGACELRHPIHYAFQIWFFLLWKAETQYNDGYHASHHLNPHRHWTEHPGHLVDNLGKYEEHSALVFQNIDFMGLWVLLMLKNYARLAELYVHLGPAVRPSSDEIIRLLKSRTGRFSESSIARIYSSPVSESTRCTKKAAPGGG